MFAILLCGGTFDKVYDPSAQILTVTEGTSAAPTILGDGRVSPDEWKVIRLMAKDSIDMDDGDRRAVLDKILYLLSEYDGAVVIHGTDTLVQTACLVKDVMGCVSRGFRAKPVIFTGAMVPHAVRGTDASFNLGFAMGVVKVFHQVGQGGVHVAIQGEVFDPAKVVKADASFKPSPLVNPFK